MKKILCILLASLTILTLILPVFASDGEQGSEINANYDISTSTISQDFAVAFGGEYKVEDYPYNPLYLVEDNIILINMLEAKRGNSWGVDFYFYFYNPTKKEIDLEADINNVRIVYRVMGDNSEEAFENVKLQYLCSENDGLLLKFKATDYFANTHYNAQMDRNYEIIEAEFKEPNMAPDVAAHSYTIGKRFTFRDNEIGFTTQYIGDVETVELEVNHTYYRWWTNEEKNEAVDLFSVYFTVPNDLLDQFDFLHGVQAEWEECEMYPCIVTNEKEVTELFSEYVLEPYIYTPEHHEEPLLSFVYDKRYDRYFDSETGSLGFSWFGYQFHPFHHMCWKQVDSRGTIDMLGGSFYCKDGWFGGLVEVPSSDVLAAQNKYGWDDVNFKYIDKSNMGESSKTFYSLKAGSLGDYLLPDLLLNLNSSLRFRKILDVNYGEHPELFAPLRQVAAEDLTLKNEEFSERYLVHKNDVQKIKNSVGSDETLFIMNYTTADYNAYTDVDFCRLPNDLKNGDFKCLIADMTAIRNFDTISLDFMKDDVHTVLYVASDRTNFTPGIEARTPKGNNGPPWWLIALIVCVCVLIVIKLYKSYVKARRERKFERKYLN